MQRPPGLILVLTALGFGSLYTPQPLLPILAADFRVSAGEASLLITLAMLPLAVAPLVYGYVLEGVPVRRMVIGAALGLGLCQAGLALVGDWWQMLLLRALEGLCLPALFTALMTATSQSAPEGQVRPAMAWYVATSILGGFAGRALSGLIAEHWHWRVAFAGWAVGLVLATLGMLRQPAAGASHFARPHPRVFVEILGLATFRYAYLAIFCVFFVFAGFLNVLPFRLRDLAPSLGAGAIGLAYGGYLAGIAVTLGGQALSRRVGSEIRVLGAGIALYAAALGIFAVNRAAALYLGMVVFCAGMFLIHGRLSGHLNHLATRSHGIVNGLYITLYYLGGSLGSWVAPLVYRNSDWSSLLLLLGLAVAAAGLSLALMARRGTGREVSP